MVTAKSISRWRVQMGFRILLRSPRPFVCVRVGAHRGTALHPIRSTISSWDPWASGDSQVACCLAQRDRGSLRSVLQVNGVVRWIGGAGLGGAGTRARTAATVLDIVYKKMNICQGRFRATRFARVTIATRSRGHRRGKRRSKRRGKRRCGSRIGSGRGAGAGDRGRRVNRPGDRLRRGRIRWRSDGSDMVCPVTTCPLRSHLLNEPGPDATCQNHPNSPQMRRSHSTGRSSAIAPPGSAKPRPAVDPRA